LYEYYTYAIDKNSNVSISDLSKTLMEKSDFIVKILSHNSLSANHPKDFYFEQYDKLFLIERPDFFNQCCSLEFAGKFNLWHRRKLSKEYEKFSSVRFPLSKHMIDYQANGVAKYLDMKKHIIDNKLDYVLHDYDDFASVPKAIIADTNLNYSEIFDNYEIKDKVDNLFSECFSYETCKYDLCLFQQELSKII
jgi:hypothetical protein